MPNLTYELKQKLHGNFFLNKVGKLLITKTLPVTNYHIQILNQNYKNKDYRLTYLRYYSYIFTLLRYIMKKS